MHWLKLARLCCLLRRPCPGIFLSTTAAKHDGRFPLFTALVLALIVAAMNIGLWWYGNLPHGPEDWHGKISGFSLAVFRRYQSPFKQDYPSNAEISSDLKLLHHYTDRVRTYTMQQSPQLYQLAQQQGLQVMAGAEIDKRLDNNEREIALLIAKARAYPHTINRVIVGNEVLYRNDLTPEQMMAYLDRVRAAVHQPVSIAEPEYIWLKYPELADHVDFITIHIFPFWNGIPVVASAIVPAQRTPALNAALGAYDELTKRFPSRHIVVGEIGWPSNGDRHLHADPSVSNEAIFIREWLLAAQQRNIDYYLLEAFDQPWEGEPRRGPHRRLLGRLQCRSQTEIPVHRAGNGRHGVALESHRRQSAGAVADDPVRPSLQPLQAGRQAVLLHADPAGLRPADVVGNAAVQFLPQLDRLDHADAAVPGAAGDPGDPADQRLRIHRGAVATRMDPPCRHAAGRSAGKAAVRVDPSGLLQRAAGDGDRHARFAGQARLRQL